MSDPKADLTQAAVSEAEKVAAGDESVEDAAKSLLTSKTVWMAAAMALLPATWPAAALWVAANPALAGLAAGAATAGMRHLTEGGLRLPTWFSNLLD